MTPGNLRNPFLEVWRLAQMYHFWVTRVAWIEFKQIVYLTKGA